jgi:hypothetical protein
MHPSEAKESHHNACRCHEVTPGLYGSQELAAKLRGRVLPEKTHAAECINSVSDPLFIHPHGLASNGSDDSIFR